MRKFSLALAAIAAFAAAPAAAGTVVVDQWYTFGFNGTGQGLISGSGFVLGVAPDSLAAPDPTWDFTLLTGGSITFLDGFNAGDQFQILDNGSIIGSTSAPGSGSCGNVITACLIDSNMSQGTFALAAGAHSISGSVLASPFGGGAGFFRVNSTAVPEPSTWAMVLLGFGAIGFAARRRKLLRTA